jgi:hypothetical protein
MTRATNTNHAYQQPQPFSQQRRQLPSGTRQQQSMTGERSSTRTSQRGTNHAAPPPLQPITHRPRQQTTAAYDADTLQEEEYDEEATDDAMSGSPLWTARSVLPYRHTRLDYPYTGERPTRASSSPPPERRLIQQRTPEVSAVARPAPRRRWRWHPLFWVGLGLFVMVIGYLLFGAASAWWQGTWDGWQYGYPRTHQTDAVVGHDDSPSHPSHFIAINLHSHIEVIEFPGGDVTHARVYLGPTLIGTGEDLTPVTLAFKDVNGDGKPDMIVSVGGTIVVFINDGGQFRPLKPGEQVTL